MMDWRRNWETEGAKVREIAEKGMGFDREVK
jgi:hypothetical protein